MKEVKVSEVMIPIANYVTVKKENNLLEVLQALESARNENEHAHRDAIVMDDDGTFLGKVTMIDIFRSLEPNYKKVEKQRSKGVLTQEFVKNAMKELFIWMEPAKSICERGSDVRIAKIMHIPKRSEYIEEDDTLEQAMAMYVMGIHQPLVVRKGEKVTGMLRFGDVFEVIRHSLLSCG